MYDTSGIGVFLGLDVGKGEHHGHGLTPAATRVFDKRLHAAGSAGGRLVWFRQLGVFVPSACRFRLVSERGRVLGGRCPGAGLVAS